MTRKMLIRYCSYIVLLVFLDQLSKMFFITYLKNQQNYIYQLLPFLDMVYAWNYGVSFGLFNEHTKYSNWIFLILNSFIVLYLGSLFKQNQSKLINYSLILIIGGALGNIVDRLFRGAVFDFIFFYYEDFYFPAFNLADSFISIGACLFILDYIFNKKHLKKKQNSAKF
jgi:signal peptidase II